MKEITVLVVEDNRSVRDFHKEVFELLGAKVFTAGNAYDAIDIIKRIQANLDSMDYFDLIVSDLEMPGKTGIELLAEIKRHNEKAISQIPFVLISGIMDEKISQQAKKLGALETAQKPISLGGLKNFLSLISH